MDEVVSSIKGVFDTLNPFNTGNLVIYFAWLVVYTFTLVAIWRSNSRIVRLVCFLINQVFSVGVILSWTLTALLAYTYWIASLGTIVIALVLAWWTFREKRVEDDKDAEKIRKEPALIGNGDG
ncbi:MAG: hypothetical protein OEQ29_06890 [Alphaproteobacteria bacterium]|nr:hypothetical protein [Alphaproteobacteria bacterium]